MLVIELQVGRMMYVYESVIVYLCGGNVRVLRPGGWLSVCRAASRGQREAVTASLEAVSASEA